MPLLKFVSRLKQFHFCFLSVFYTQYLYSVYGLKHPPLKLLYENPKEYNRLDNENVKVLVKELKNTYVNVYLEMKKKLSKPEDEAGEEK